MFVAKGTSPDHDDFNTANGPFACLPYISRNGDTPVVQFGTSR
ncbi:hypothetical protein AVEN_262989-1, partial [Araneus ventricosus]